MPHEILIDGSRCTLCEVIDIGRNGMPPLVRVVPLANGDAAVITAAAASRDGVPVVGQLARIERGSGAIIRSGSLQLAIAWQSRGERRAPVPGERCRVCFGAFDAGAETARCVCDAVFHSECDRVRLTCPGCGAAPEVCDT